MEVEKSEVKNKTVGEYMKLGIICTMINGFGRRGYYNTQEIGLGRELERQGHEVTIYKCVKKTGGESIERVKLGNTLSILYIPVSSFGAHGCLDTAVLSTDLDAVLCFADNQIFLPHIYRFCARHEIRMVPYIGRTHSSSGGVHGFAMNTLFHLGTLRWFRRGPAISKIEEVRQELLQLGVKDVKVAPVGLDFSVMKSDFATYDRAALRREFGLLPEDMVICTVGRMGPEKNPLDLVEIYQQVREQKPCKLLLVGEGTQSEDLKTKIAASKWKSDIVLIDRKPAPGMLMEAARRFNIDLASSWIVGDGSRDIQAGKNAGCKTALLCADVVPPKLEQDWTATSLYNFVGQVLCGKKEL